MASSLSLSSASSSVKSTSEREVSLIFLQPLSPTKAEPAQQLAAAPAPKAHISLELVERDAAVANAHCAPGVAGASDAHQRAPPAARCAVCNATFASARMKNLHERVAHDRAACHRCPHCCGIFGHIADLNAHLLSAHRGVGYDHACGDCGAAFASATLLRQHAALHARRRLPPADVQCTKCDFSAPSVGEVRFHMADQHGVWDVCLGKENFDSVPRRALRDAATPRTVLLLRN